MKVVVGIGNPGRSYAGTRHNVGFEVVDAVARSEGASFRETDGPAETAVLRRDDGERVLLVKPMTYVNLSGTVLAPLARSFGRPDEDGLLVVCDDLNLPVGRLRVRGKGSSGGHNGLKSVIEHWGSETFARLRLGVGGAAPGEAVGRVLGKFAPDERPAIEAAVERAAEAVRVWLREGLDACMNRFNPTEG